MQKLEELIKKIQAKKNESPDLIKGEWNKDNKYLKDSNGQTWKVTIDDKTIEYNEDGEITYMLVLADKDESNIKDDKMEKNMLDYLEVDTLTWNFPYWMHKRPEESTGIIQKRDTRGGLAFDGLVMLDYKLYKINLWERKGTEAFNIDGREERAEKARLQELSKNK